MLRRNWVDEMQVFAGKFMPWVATVVFGLIGGRQKHFCKSVQHFFSVTETFRHTPPGENVVSHDHTGSASGTTPKSSHWAAVPEALTSFSQEQRDVIRPNPCTRPRSNWGTKSKREHESTVLLL